jgi:ribosomal protein S1
VQNLTDIAKPGDTRDFMIVSLEPEQHRLGLSLKALEEKEGKKGGEKEGEEDKA